MEKVPFSYAYTYPYAYVIQVHACFSGFSHAYVYACVYAYAKVLTSPKFNTNLTLTANVDQWSVL